jgi:guanine deaminase
MDDSSDLKFLRLAIDKARESVEKGGFPAGALVVKEEKILGEGISIGNILNDPTSHGETSSIRDACKNLKTSDLSGATLYASMQPCLMCLGAAMWGSISRIVFACSKEKVSSEYYGGSYVSSDINSQFNKPIELKHLPELEEESLEVVRGWEKQFEKS